MAEESRELRTYRRKLPELHAHEGKYAVISGEDIVGLYDTYADAIQTAYDRCPIDRFIVKRVEAVERVFTFSRGLTAG